MKEVKIPEIMAPVGSYESLAAAINAQADSVYFGVTQLNMRARSANNFTLDDLAKIVEISQKSGVRTYLALNTILYDHDLNLMHAICDAAKRAGITAVIVADVAAILYAHSIGLEVHISTQVNVSNIEEVKFYAQWADTIVLARELSLDQIKAIVAQIREQQIKGPRGQLVEIEVFVHGALCVAISGKCYMSLATENASANRGACVQNCRYKYTVTNQETGEQLALDNEYIMSPKDLCTIGMIDKLMDAGVQVFKIEGRGRSADYVDMVVRTYREARDSVIAGAYTEEKIAHWTEQLSTVYNRGFWMNGYYLGKKMGEWSGQYGSRATKKKLLVGVVEHFYPKVSVAQIAVQSHSFSVGDELIISGNNTGVVRVKVEKILINDEPVQTAHAKQVATIPLAERVRNNDRVYIVVDNKTT